MPNDGSRLPVAGLKMGLDAHRCGYYSRNMITFSPYLHMLSGEFSVATHRPEA